MDRMYGMDLVVCVVVVWLVGAGLKAAPTGVAVSCRFVYILRRCQYLQGGCGGVADDIEEQAMLVRNQLMRKLWRLMLLLLLAALVMPTISASAASSTGSCATEGAVSDADENPGLVADCEALLAARDTLAGTATLNWSAGIPMVEWEGLAREVRLDVSSGCGLTKRIWAVRFRRSWETCRISKDYSFLTSV